MGDNNLNLEGLVVLISGDSKDSRKTTRDIAREFNQDHEMGSRVIALNVHRTSYANGRLNFEIRSAEGDMPIEKINHIIKNGDNYFISKLENPFLAKPLKFLMDPVINDFGSRFYDGLISKGSSKTFKNEFRSYIGSKIPVVFRDVLNTKLLESNLFNISNNLYKLFDNFSDDLTNAFKKSNGSIDVANGDLGMFKHALSGFLNDIVEPRPMQYFLDELRAVSNHIGNEIISKDDKGRFNLVIPFLDMRSDHNVKNPYEFVRIKEDANLAANANVNRLLTIQPHSQIGVEAFVNRGVDVTALTQTNEFISIMIQNLNIDLCKMYVQSPDLGGIYDSMVYARETSIRTKGEFPGLMIGFEKERSDHGKVKNMNFVGAWKYNPDKDHDRNVIKEDLEGNRMPYDLVYASEFKIPGHKNNISNLFDQVYGPNDLEKLKKEVNGWYAILRDDILATFGTGETAMRASNKLFNSKSIMYVEHFSAVDKAKQRLIKLHKEGILDAVVTSTSVYHPDLHGDLNFVQQRTMSDRFKKYIKKEYMNWLGESHPVIHTHLKKYFSNK